VEEKEYNIHTVVTEWRTWKIKAESRDQAKSTFYEEIDVYSHDDQIKFSTLADCKSGIEYILPCDEKDV
tara:strand:+ start:215 stop:421 length:207 start_codon:yes stop_codon:yes gene_type:complete